MKTELYPFLFEPIFKERIWGGRKLESLYRKALPPGQSIGESWEVCDRTDDNSVIRNGPLKGRNLRWLMENHRLALMGGATDLEGRFPLLIKLLDARETLSLQVHPPVDKAKELGGHPKTEMWYVTAAEPEAKLYAGLKRGTTRQEFEKRLGQGTVAECFHQIPVKEGSVMFLPSGRVHALGAGIVLFEIQQNSDTTYRVDDWNRKDASGKPRELHIPQSLASIDFADYEPGLIDSAFSENRTMKVRYLVNHPLFRVDAVQVKKGQRFYLSVDAAVILAVVKGGLEVGGEKVGIGEFVLLPAALERVTVVAPQASLFLQIQPG